MTESMVRVRSPPPVVACSRKRHRRAWCTVCRAACMTPDSGPRPFHSTRWRGRLRSVPDSLPLIWLVDDSRTQIVFTEHALGPRYPFERFEDGASVVQRLCETAVMPDLLILDWV